MKKIMNVILVLVLVVGVVFGVNGCTKQNKNKNQKSADDTQGVTTEAVNETKNTKDNSDDKDKSDIVNADSETVKADNTAKTDKKGKSGKKGKTEDDSDKKTSTQAPTTQEPRTEEPTTAHQHTWKTVVDKDEWDEPIYEEQDVYEWHSMWPDGSYADNLTDPGAKAQWCIDHCTRCFPNCPDPDPAGRCALHITDGEVWVGTEKVQTGTRHHDAVTHQECSVCGARK